MIYIQDIVLNLFRNNVKHNIWGMEMSSIQEMIEMQNRIAKMVEPIADIWNNPAINYLQQNAVKINQVSQCAQQIATSLEPILENYALNSALQERQQIISSMTSGLEMFRTPEYIDTIQSVADRLGNMTESLSLFSGIIKNFNIPQKIIENSFIDYIRGISQSMVAFEDEILRQDDNIKSVIPLLYNEFFDNIDLEENNLTRLTNRICEQMASNSEEEIDLQAEEGFTNDTEIREALIEQANHPEGFQERFSDWSEKKKKQFYILFLIWSFIWSNFLRDDFKQYVCQPVKEYVVAKIRELPNKDAGVVGELKDEQAIVTGDEPYYYKIMFIGEDGKEHEGFVSKRSVILIEDFDKKSDME